MEAATPLGAHRTVGQPVSQIDSMEKANGLARYLHDLSVPGMLHGAIVRSPIPHGRIRSIDVSRAERLPGVRGVVTARDCPGLRFGPQKPADWEILCSDRVRYVGDEVAAVAAITPEIARAAAALVDVEYEELPAIYDPFAAMSAGAPVLWPESPDNVAYHFHIERGDVEAGFASADYVFEHDFYTGRLYHAQLEPIGCIVQYHPDGSYTMWGPTHVPFRSRMTYSRGLGVSMDRIRIIVPPFGGSFGMKYELNVNCIAAVLSKKCGPPVKILYTREEDVSYGHPRMGINFHFKLGLTAAGRFVAKEARVVGTGGARTMWTPPVLQTACHRIDSLYHFHNVRADGFLVYTNQSPATCFRGFGNAEALTAFETFLDTVAEKIDLDPVELRRINGVAAGDVSLHGWRIASCGFRDCLDRAEEMSNFRTRRKAPATLPRSGVLRGKGFAAGNHISGNRIIIDEFDGSSAQVRLGFDGHVHVIGGDPDIGQGMNTVFAQIAAEVLGLDAEMVSIFPIDTMISPHGVGTLGSRGTTIGGKAVQLAAEDARDQIVQLAAELLGRPRERVRLLGGYGDDLDEPGRRVSFREIGTEYAKRHGGAYLLGKGDFTPPTEFPDTTKYGNLSAAYVFGAHVAEVEVDVETGAVRVVNFWAVHDCGTVINPSTAAGQVHGGVAQGISSALTEEVLVRDGRVLNPNFLDYRIPGFQDVPIVQVGFVETIDPYGPFGAKSIGESSLNPAAAAVCNAIYNAVGVRTDRVPVTPERLWRLIHERRRQAAEGRSVLPAHAHAVAE
jgi:CO/xanthine dehydrogenase Mo-binding subunit